MIRDIHDSTGHGIRPICAVLGVPRSSYYHERIHQKLDYRRPWHLYRPASGQPQPKTRLAEAA